MGGTQSQFSEYINGFAEVATKTKWKNNLIINIANKYKFIVVGIQESTDATGQLRVEDHFGGRLLIYTYTGDQIIGASSYTNNIYLKELPAIKIGGGKIINKSPGVTNENTRSLTSGKRPRAPRSEIKSSGKVNVIKCKCGSCESCKSNESENIKYNDAIYDNIADY